MNYGRIRRGSMAASVLQRDFTQIHNRLFRDSRLSFKAKGIFGLISTHRDGYGVSADWIADASTDGVAAVKTGLRELERYGYLVRHQEVRKDGTKGSMTYTITDMPSSEPVDGNEPAASTCDDAQTRRSEPLVDYPPADEPPTVDRTHKKTNSKNTSGEKTLSPAAAPKRRATAAKAVEEREIAAPDNTTPAAETASQSDGPAQVLAAYEGALGAKALNGTRAKLLADAVELLEARPLWWVIDRARELPQYGVDLAKHAGMSKAPVTRRAASKPGALPAWCGHCGDGNSAARTESHYRVYVDDNGFTRPCPTCNPKAAATSAA